MLKLIGVFALVGGVAFTAAVYTGVIDFHSETKVTAKGEAQVQELRNSAADFVRGAGQKVGDAVESPSK